MCLRILLFQYARLKKPWLKASLLYDGLTSARTDQQSYQNNNYSHAQQQSQPSPVDQFSTSHKLGATFYPGAQDDYYVSIYQGHE